jgi:cysteine-rich repeat protein
MSLLAGCLGSGRDAVYTVTPPIAGTMRVSVPFTSFNVTLAMRYTCIGLDPSGVIACSNKNGTGGSEEIVFAVEAGTTYFIVVDSPSSSSFGRFTLDVELQPPICGDGFTSSPEECDDGNLTSGDGCGPTCRIEPTPGSEACPGFTVGMSASGADRRAVLVVDTSSYDPNTSATCGGSGPEAVFRVVPELDGTLTAELAGAEGLMLHARSTCADVSSQIACDALAPIRITTPAVAGTPIFLFVDGYNGAAGKGTLTLTVSP